MSNTQFKGSIGRTWEDSKPWWPQPTRAPADAPDIVYIILDDVGYGWLSCYGGPIDTPNIDKLAANGLLYNNWHTTALCSPTRACLLTGRNHHSVGMGAVTDLATGFPGYNGMMPKDKACVGAMLRQYGYNTYCVGKWHNTAASETGPEGPFDRWPNGEMMGFDRFYGFLGGDCNQWYPSLFWDNHPIATPKTPEEGYHLSIDLVDKAILFISNHESVGPEKPFFVYYAPGATHAPHHVPKEWSDKYKGKFDQGWDKVREETLARQKELGVIQEDAELTKRHEEIPAWDDVDPALKPVLARQMEVYAGFMEHTDHQLGRVIAALEDLEILDDTLVYAIIGDNGASAEGTPNGTFNEMMVLNGAAALETTEFMASRIDDFGTPRAYNHYSVGWAHAMDAPYQWTKQVASHWGGTRNGTIVRWPSGIKGTGEQRSQFHHVIDVAPTVLEAAGVPEPTFVHGVQQSPMEGISMAYSFDDDAAAERHETQYFEMFVNRGIYHKGWTAVTRHSTPWVMTPELPPFDEDVWELYAPE